MLAASKNSSYFAASSGISQFWLPDDCTATSLHVKDSLQEVSHAHVRRVPQQIFGKPSGLKATARLPVLTVPALRMQQY